MNAHTFFYTTLVLLGCSASCLHAQNTPPVGTKDDKAEIKATHCLELLNDKNESGQVSLRMGDTLRLGLHGSLKRSLQERLADPKTAGDQTVLYFNGARLDGVKPVFFEKKCAAADAEVADAKTKVTQATAAQGKKAEFYKQKQADHKNAAEAARTAAGDAALKSKADELKKAAEDAQKEVEKAHVETEAAKKALEAVEAKAREAVELEAHFFLDRDADNDTNRKAWDGYFRTKLAIMNFEDRVEAGLAVPGQLPVLLESGNLYFRVNDGGMIWTVAAIGIAVFILGFLLVKSLGMLRDGDAKSAYSLGKTQMAFWGLLAVISFACISTVTGRMERIPPQILILIGISGTTGLGALMLGSTKRAEADERMKKLVEDRDTLEAEKAGLAEGAVFPGDKVKQLTNIEKEIKYLTEEAFKSSGNFLKDITYDGNGLSFHRLQVVLWTLVLGAFFVRSVLANISMPEFSDTLLVLMGISSGTYLGFKIPEKP